MPSSRDPEVLRRADVVLLRHGETTYNTRQILNGDPSVEVPLSETGRRQAEEAARLLQGIAWSRVYVTRFRRTHETAAIVAPGLPTVVLPLLDDIDLGVFESRPRDDYRAWRREHGVDEAPPGGGEARRDVARRYARGLALLAAEAPRPTLVVTHDQPIRYLENVLIGEDPILGEVEPVPNAVPYPYDRGTLARGAEAMDAAVPT